MKTLPLETLLLETSRSVEETFNGMFATKVSVLNPIEANSTSFQDHILVNSSYFEGVIEAKEGEGACMVAFAFPKATIFQLLKSVYGEGISETSSTLEQGVGEITNVISTKTRARLNNSGYSVKINNPKVRIIDGTSLVAMEKSEVVLPVETPTGPFRIIFHFTPECRFNIDKKAA